MDSKNTDRLCPIAVVGFGKMGEVYVALLQEFGYRREDLVVVDKDPSRLAHCQLLHPGITTVADFATALKRKPQTVINLTNTVAHFPILKLALLQKIPYVFTEKPLVAKPQLAQWMQINRGSTLLCTGYHFAHSGAVDHLVHFLKDSNLCVQRGSSTWCKNRINDPRPTAGVLIDEATHPIQLLLYLAKINQTYDNLAVEARLSFTPYGRDAMKRDIPSYLKTPATAEVDCFVRAGESELKLSISSSFIAPLQKRELTLVLVSATGKRLSPMIATINFDETGQRDLQDYILVRAQRDQKVISSSYPSKSKIELQLKRFFAWASGEGDMDPRLVDLDQATQLVKIAEAARLSDRERCRNVI